MSSILILKKGITEIETDAMVNAANTSLLAGGGVCGAIFRAAGTQELQEACDKLGHCETGKAVITPGFRSKAKYIIHTPGPVWNGGKNKEPELLYSCYQEALKLAAEHGCHTITFPLISAGIFGYPKEEAWRIAMRSCYDFIQKHPDTDMKITFAVLDDEALRTGRRIREETAEGKA